MLMLILLLSWVSGSDIKVFFRADLKRLNIPAETSFSKPSARLVFFSKIRFFLFFSFHFFHDWSFGLTDHFDVERSVKRAADSGGFGTGRVRR